MNRRDFLGSGVLGLAALAQPQLWAAVNESLKKTAIAESFDREVNAFMVARKIPGGALAVVKDGRLVYARGYGWADREKKIPAKADSLFRIASVSKPITAVAVMKLVEENKLNLDTRAFDILKIKPALSIGKKPDPRLERITLRQLLQHTGGWDRDKSFDPMFRSQVIAEKLSLPAPADSETIIRYMFGKLLDFDPGTRYAYSNFGYCVLGRLIEKITGQSYEKYVREKILAPIGVTRMRIGASLDGRQAEGEIRYYTSDNATIQSVFPQAAGKVPWPYGGFNIEAMDAHGGWIASAVDLARFAASLDRAWPAAILKSETLQLMVTPPPSPVSRDVGGKLNDSYYACGWSVRPVGRAGKANYWHNGSLPGTSTLFVRRWDGLSWVALFNQRSDDQKLPDDAIDAGLHRAADAVMAWPSKDLFDSPERP